MLQEPKDSREDRASNAQTCKNLDELRVTAARCGRLTRVRVGSGRRRFPVAGAGFALFLLSIIITACHLRTDIIVPVGWLIISVITGACLWYVPAQYTYWGACGAAAAACVIMLFLPGLSPSVG